MAEGMTDALENAVMRAETELKPSTSTVLKGFLRNLSPFTLPASRNPEQHLVHLEYQEAHIFSLEALCGANNELKEVLQPPDTKIE